MKVLFNRDDLLYKGNISTSPTRWNVYAKNNFTAQSLYEKIGYIRDNDFYSYSFELK